LLGAVREETPFGEVPIKLVLKAKGAGGKFKEETEKQTEKEEKKPRKPKKRGSTTWDV
jgi:hypothetical protein